jgi:hypothetical protein
MQEYIGFRDGVQLLRIYSSTIKCKCREGQTGVSFDILLNFYPSLVIGKFRSEVKFGIKNSLIGFRQVRKYKAVAN